MPRVVGPGRRSDRHGVVGIAVPVGGRRYVQRLVCDPRLVDAQCAGQRGQQYRHVDPVGRQPGNGRSVAAPDHERDVVRAQPVGMGVLEQRPQHVTEYPTAGRLVGQSGDRRAIAFDIVATCRRVDGVDDDAYQLTRCPGHVARHATILPGRYGRLPGRFGRLAGQPAYEAVRSTVGHRTWYAQRSRSNSQISRAVASSCPGRIPCRAQVGSAWCPLCQLSPSDGRARAQTLVARSRLWNGRSPIRWQIELTDQVTWCSTVMRTIPAQNSAVSAPVQVPVTAPPTNAGTSSEAAASGPKSRPITRRSRSATRSGANRIRLLSSRRSIQPTWAYSSPLTTATGPVP